MGESLLILVSVWLLFLVGLIYLLRQVAAGGMSRWQGLARGWLGAEARADALLDEMLTERERRQLTQVGYVEVKSPHYPGRVYRIPGTPGRVRVFDRNRELYELCLEPAEPLPYSDVIALHKLLILGNEREYLATANRFAPGMRWMAHRVI
jgi:hypothetical protein